jgi:hypothetical protein
MADGTLSRFVAAGQCGRPLVAARARTMNTSPQRGHLTRLPARPADALRSLPQRRHVSRKRSGTTASWAIGEPSVAGMLFIRRDPCLMPTNPSFRLVRA